MIELVLKLLGTGLSLWESKEKTKYLDKLVSLKKDYYEEINKPYEERDDAKLSNIDFELKLMAEAFAAQVQVTK